MRLKNRESLSIQPNQTKQAVLKQWNLVTEGGARPVARHLKAVRSPCLQHRVRGNTVSIIFGAFLDDRKSATMAPKSISILSFCVFLEEHELWLFSNTSHTQLLFSSLMQTSFLIGLVCTWHKSIKKRES